MKKTLLAMTLMAASAISSSAFAADGAVNFVGNITDTACKIDAGSLNQNVPMGTVSKTAFSGAGSVAAAHKFTLTLTDCPSTVTDATVRFDGTQIPGDNSILQLTDAANSSTAQGVGIQISDNQSKVVPLYEDSSAYTLVATAPNKLDFTARYIATSATVTAGKANAVTQFTIVYK